jgi:hypothetical protein
VQFLFRSWFDTSPRTKLHPFSEQIAVRPEVSKGDTDTLFIRGTVQVLSTSAIRTPHSKFIMPCAVVIIRATYPV